VRGVLLDDPIGLGLFEFRGEPELLWALEFDGIDEYDANSLDKAETVTENVSRGVDV
jgi:hypothetical protein